MIDHLLINGNIYTLDSANPKANTIAISRDRIFAVGGKELQSLAGPQTQIHDLEGAMVLPGFTDSHIHWSWTALTLKEINLFDVPSKEQAVNLIAKGAEKIAEGKWVRGFGWAQGPWEGGKFPTADDLDRVVPDKPVFMDARSGHAAWVNSLALKLAGINEHSPDPKGGEIQRDSNGKPTGILFEEAINLVRAIVPKPTTQDIVKAVDDAQPHAWAAGLTSMHDYDCKEAFEAYQILNEEGRLGIRTVKHINDPYIHHAHAIRLRSGFGGPWLRVGGLKIFADGALGSVTAKMIEPYDNDPNNRGITVTPKEKIIELSKEATRLGFYSTIHAIGDEAVRDVLDALEEVRHYESKLDIPRKDRRHRIEHFQIVHPDDLKRPAELDIICSFQPIHATADYPLADVTLGERGRCSYNPRIQIDHGAHIAFGSDAPVEPFDPLKGIHAAVTRRRADGSPGPQGWWPEGRVTVDEAIRAYTTDAAYAVSWENELGRLAENYYADLVVLSEDLYKIDPNETLNVQVVGTMAGGIWRHGHWRE